MGEWGRAALTVIPAAPQPSFPRKRESRTVLPYDAAVLAINREIPAYAGMTVESAAQYIQIPPNLVTLRP